MAGDGSRRTPGGARAGLRAAIRRGLEYEVSLLSAGEVKVSAYPVAAQHVAARRAGSATRSRSTRASRSMSTSTPSRARTTAMNKQWARHTSDNVNVTATRHTVTAAGRPPAEVLGGRPDRGGAAAGDRHGRADTDVSGAAGEPARPLSTSSRSLHRVRGLYMNVFRMPVSVAALGATLMITGAGAQPASAHPIPSRCGRWRPVPAYASAPPWTWRRWPTTPRTADDRTGVQLRDRRERHEVGVAGADPGHLRLGPGRRPGRLRAGTRPAVRGHTLVWHNQLPGG